jgi:hypothetical protein
MTHNNLTLPLFAALTLIAQTAGAQSVIAKDDNTARCTPEESRSVLKKTRAAIARVEGPGASALGVVFHTKKHVLTTFDVVRAGRGVRVTMSDGIERGARIASIDRTHNLALLELDSTAGWPSNIPPLVPSVALDVGDPVLVLARAFTIEAPAEDVLVPGAVTARKGDRIRVNALETHHWSYGSPVLDCRGQVAAIAVDMFDDAAVLLSETPSLPEAIGTTPEYRGDWSIEHPSFGGVFQFDRTIPRMDRLGVGLSLGTALIGEDEWYFPFRFSVLGMGEANPDDEDTTKRTGLRLQLEAGFGYRFMLSEGEIPLYFTPTIGLVGGYERWWERTERQVITDSSCSVSRPCDVEFIVEESAMDIGYLRPTLGVALQIGFGEIGYQFQLDVDKPERSTHQWYLGLQF